MSRGRQYIEFGGCLVLVFKQRGFERDIICDDYQLLLRRANDEYQEKNTPFPKGQRQLETLRQAVGKMLEKPIVASEDALDATGNAR